MNQIEFEHECSRAELLGIAPPTWDEFCAQWKEKNSQNDNITEDGLVDESISNETVETLNEQGESLKRNIGGLDELNSLLASTQLKINRFKTVCGSFTNLMKLKNWKGDGTDGQMAGETSPSSVPVTPNRRRKDDEIGDSGIASEVSSQVDRLGSLLDKAERAEISMSKQNKEMKAMIRK